MIKNKIMFRNFLWNTAGSTLASFNSLFFLIIVTRMNGMENAGIFSITVTTASILYMFAIYSGRNCHITDTQNIIKDKDYIVSRILTCIGMLILTFAFMIWNQYGMYQNLILLSLCLWKCFEAFADVFYAVLQKNEHLYEVGQSLVLKSLLGIILFVAINWITQNLVLACASLAVTSLLIILCFDLPKAIPFIKQKETVTFKNVKNIYQKEFFLFAGAFLTMYILNAPKYAIETYLTNQVQAIFGIILMPASVLPLFAQFIISPLMNQLTKYYKEKDFVRMKQLEKKMRISILGFGILALGVAYLIGIPVLNLIYQVDLGNYKLELLGILLAYIIYAIGFVKTIILTIFRNIKEQFWIYLLLTVIVFLLSNGLIKFYGEKGIIPIYLIIMAIYYLLFSLVTKYQYKKREKENEPTKSSHSPIDI